MAILSRNLTDRQKDAYLHSMSYILNIDKKENGDKKEYLKTKLHELGLPLSNLSKIKKGITAEEVVRQLRGIGNIRVRRFILRDMILLALSDRELTDEEIQTIYKIGTGANIKQEKINDLFLWAAKGVEWQIEGARLVEEDL